MSFYYGPQGDCYCELFRDEFDRLTINTATEPRYHESSGSVAPYSFGFPGLLTWSYTTSAWSIASGVLTCSTSNKWLRHFTTSLSGGEPPPLAYSAHVQWEFDLTFSGSGAVYLGNWLKLDYSAGAISIRDRSSGVNRFTFPWSLVSGTTYRITIRTAAAGAGATQDFELLIDGVLVRKTKIAQQHWGVYGFVGTGTLEIDNVAVDKLYNTPCGSDCPQTLAPCFFPWLGSSYASQLQLDIPGEVVTGCLDCTTPVKNIAFVGTHVLDRITSGCLAAPVFGLYTRCVCYSLTASFGCYSRLDVSFGVENLSGTLYERVDMWFTGSGLPDRVWGWLLTSTQSTTEAILAGPTLELVAANFSGTCRPTAITMTPLV